MNNETTIDVLNKLIVINNDRIEGYETAATETEEADLKDLFHRFIQTSQTCKTALVAEVHKLGGTPDEGTRVTGKFFRAWMDVKAFLTGKDRVSILNSCEFGENAAQDTYKSVANNQLQDLNAEQQRMLSTQQNLLKMDLETVVNLRNMLVVAEAK